MDKKVISCAFNIDTACVEVRFVDSSMIAIDCTLVEAEVARNMYESSELEWLVYHAPVDYVNLLLHGDVREYLRNTTDYHPLEN
ncbi:MAG: DUF6061 family protein [Candidatus Faecousia sp.]|nr:DUF6061 family protein [Candidatus Faecousia sp.]